jgi:hypothetical protein
MLKIRRLMLGLAMMAIGGWSHAVAQGSGVVYVAPTGNDSAAGTAAAPLRTIQAAIASGASVMNFAVGEYLNQTTVTVDAGRTIRGGYEIINGEWRRGGEQTVFLNTAVAGSPSFVLAETSGEFSGGRMEGVRIVGGFASVEMRPGARLYDVELSGGSNSAIFIGMGQPNNPSIIERVEVTGGQIGIRIIGSGSADIRNTKTRGTIGNGLDVRGTGTVTISSSVFQRSSASGAVVGDNPNVTFTNSVFRRNTGDGLRVDRVPVVVRGCLFELNENGLVLTDSEGALIENISLTTSRRSGLVVTRSTPDVYRSIFAYNSSFGVREEQVVAPPETPLPAITRILRDNLFWQNSAGAYLDEGVTIIDTEAGLNAGLTNREPATGNRLVDPQFVNLGTGNFRLQSTSPAIGAVSLTPAWNNDLDGNPRLVGGSIDLGAFEHQGANLIRDGFAALYNDSSIGNDEGTLVEIQRHPLWEFDPVAPFKPMRGSILPGRFRVTAYQGETLGFAYRRADDIVQPHGKIARIRQRISSPGDGFKLTTRIRANWWAQFHTATMLSVDGAGPLAPTAAGRTYELFVDLAQGPYRTQTAQQLAGIRYLFNTDFWQFLSVPNYPPSDVESLEVEFLDRDTYAAQFTELRHSWTFENDVEGWIAEPAFPGYGEPILRYSAERKALEAVRLQFFNYRTWRSPIFALEPGEPFLIKYVVSSNRPQSQTTSFRTRFSDLFFGTTVEQQALAQEGGLSIPSQSGTEYWMFGRMPAELTDDRCQFFFDLYSFDSESRGGSLFLEDVRIYTIPTP